MRSTTASRLPGPSWVLVLFLGLGIAPLVENAAAPAEEDASPPDAATETSESIGASSTRVLVADISPEAERAIDRGLAYIAEHQHDDGSWGSQHQVAVTALSLMAFMVRGYLPERPPYGRVMTAGLDYLIRVGREGGGYLGASMYEHGLATLAFSEAWGMSSRSDQIRDVLKRAVTIILRAQNRQGGWRYHPQPRDADISATVMQIVALASAKEAGILVPDAVIQRAIAYVKSLQDDASGGFGYQNAREPGFARTAAGVMSLLMCGDRTSENTRRGLEYLRKLPESEFRDTRWFYYGHYYAVQAMYQAGEGHYQAWYPRIRDALIAGQRQNGSWSEEHGTPMAILVLAVPYRFLPIYQR